MKATGKCFLLCDCSNRITRKSCFLWLKSNPDKNIKERCGRWQSWHGDTLFENFQTHPLLHSCCYHRKNLTSLMAGTQVLKWTTHTFERAPLNQDSIVFLNSRLIWIKAWLALSKVRSFCFSNTSCYNLFWAWHSTTNYFSNLTVRDSVRCLQSSKVSTATPDYIWVKFATYSQIRAMY